MKPLELIELSSLICYKTKINFKTTLAN